MINPSQPSHHPQDQAQTLHRVHRTLQELAPGYLSFIFTHAWPVPILKLCSHTQPMAPLCLAHIAPEAEVLCPQSQRPHPRHPSGVTWAPFPRRLLCLLGLGSFPPLCSETLRHISIIEFITYIINFWLVSAFLSPPHISFLSFLRTRAVTHLSCTMFCTWWEECNKYLLNVKVHEVLFRLRAACMHILSPWKNIKIKSKHLLMSFLYPTSHIVLAVPLTLSLGLFPFSEASLLRLNIRNREEEEKKKWKKKIIWEVVKK